MNLKKRKFNHNNFNYFIISYIDYFYLFIIIYFVLYFQFNRFVDFIFASYHILIPLA